jgi:hypothetical protein
MISLQAGAFRSGAEVAFVLFHFVRLCYDGVDFICEIFLFGCFLYDGLEGRTKGSGHGRAQGTGVGVSILASASSGRSSSAYSSIVDKRQGIFDFFSHAFSHHIGFINRTVICVLLPVLTLKISFLMQTKELMYKFILDGFFFSLIFL